MRVAAVGPALVRSAVLPVLAALAAGCGNMVVLHPPTLPHAYDNKSDLGTLTIAPVRDERPFPPILDRDAMRRHGCIEGRDMRRITIFEDGVSQTWLREPQFLQDPFVETLERSLAGEARASDRFRGGAGKPAYEMNFRLEEMYIQVVVREEGDQDLFTGALVPMAAGMVPVPGVNIGVSVLANRGAATATVECELSGVVTVNKGGDEVFVRRVEVKLKEKGMALFENQLIGKVLDTAVSRVTHQAVADACRSLDGTADAPAPARQKEDRP